jgi:hypothetical protein
LKPVRGSPVIEQFAAYRFFGCRSITSREVDGAVVVDRLERAIRAVADVVASAGNGVLHR